MSYQKLQNTQYISQIGKILGQCRGRGRYPNSGGVATLNTLKVVKERWAVTCYSQQILSYPASVVLGFRFCNFYALDKWVMHGANILLNRLVGY